MQDPRAVFRLKDKKLDFNKNTWDSPAVFDIQGGVALRLTYLFNSWLLHTPPQ
jgi:hypothetical protein